MQAFTKSSYGGPEVLKLKDLLTPQPNAHQILIKVQANSANPADWHILRGKPFLARFSFGLFKPKEPILGGDFAGTVQEVGSEVKDYKIGDRVFGEKLDSAFAEYCVVESEVIAKIPNEASFEEMAALPIAGLTALQGLTSHGNLSNGESVLINGASGGVGHFTVQIAKALGARVTGVCSSRNADFVKSLGADEVVPYDQINLKEYSQQHDLIIDTHGNLSHSDLKRLGKRGVLIGFTTMSNMFRVLLSNAFSKFSLKQFTAQAKTKDLQKLATLVSEKKLQSHIERIYPWEEIPEAIAFIEKMRTRGKVVMSRGMSD